MAFWHLAQINIARARAPLTDPLMADFVTQLDAVNAVAEGSPGFLWRLKADDGSPSSYVKFSDNDRIIVNMSVWESIEALEAYVYRVQAHADVFRNRRRWFEPIPGPQVALWWVPAGRRTAAPADCARRGQRDCRAHGRSHPANAVHARRIFTLTTPGIALSTPLE
jgi:hypothetical protein